MERYNVIISRDESSRGALVMPTETYGQMVRDRPGFFHENAGDFFSPVDRTDLGKALQTNLSLALLGSGKQPMLVSSRHFNSPDFKSEGGIYVVEGRNGSRIYTPDLDDDCSHFQEYFYRHIALAGVMGLFSGTKEGRIQKQVEETTNELVKANYLLMQLQLKFL